MLGARGLPRALRSVETQLAPTHHPDLPDSTRIDTCREPGGVAE
jgi:hypothetical protein